MPQTIQAFTALNVILILWLAIVYIFAPRIDKRYLWLIYYVAGCIFCIAIACRPLLLPDTSVYVAYYDVVANMSLEHVLSYFDIWGGRSYWDMESGWMLLTWLIAQVTGAYFRLYLFVIAVFQTGLFMYGVNKVTELFKEKTGHDYFQAGFNELVTHSAIEGKIAMLMVFISYFGNYYGGIAIRAGMVIGIMMLVSYHVIKKNWMRAIVWFIIAFTLQRLAACIIPIALIMSRTSIVNKRKPFFMLLGTYTLVIFSGYFNYFFPIIAQIFQTISSGSPLADYMSYIDRSGYLETGIGLTDFWRVGIFFLLLIAATYKNEFYRRMICVVGMGLIVNLLTRCITGSDRITDFFMAFQIPLTYYLFTDGVDFVKFKGNQFRIFIIIVILGNTAVFYHAVQVSLNGN